MATKGLEFRYGDCSVWFGGPMKIQAWGRAVLKRSNASNFDTSISWLPLSWGNLWIKQVGHTEVVLCAALESL